MVKSDFLKGISVLAGGTMVAQVVTFLATIYLTQLYLPDSFGLLSLGTSIISLCIPFATLRFDKAITIAENDKEIYNLIVLSFISNTFVSVAILIIGLIIYFFNLFTVIHYSLVFIIPFSVFLYGLINVFQMYFDKRTKFNVTSKSVIIDALSKSGIQFTLHNFFPFLGMLLGYVAALIISTSYYYYNTVSLVKKCKENISKKNLYTTAKKYDKFPKFYALSNILKSASHNICSFTFPLLFSLTILGNFSIAFKIVKLPAQLLSMAIRRAYCPKGASLYLTDKKALLRLYLKSTKVLIFISIIPFIIFQVFADDLFKMFFKESWWAAADYAKVILLYVLFNIINSLAHENMIIFGLQKKLLFIEILWLILSLILIFVASNLNSAYLAVVFYALVGVFMEIIVFTIQYKKIRSEL
ncbi:oligosaccharide flippase family protein [Lacinutrix sp. 5H-3-7-4]|uniref:oligosaccharide flippase family protein n=1 Tax=Lacinutrix sp. (strain 5H-3-7-4) TaxID=983544 RepID=UPI00020A38A5|nr:oligosaccharide flippase family protein [Lacinutrix sp. 5H-3-7-4]AEH00882.1 polysaccharide biosynthesis protein [Lacinutrix sp. 5H-3-7-4]